ncbi:MAG: polyisoprenoid-binding protein [Candidatus Omnitrophica bacterium]|nr:polyisoprenoid-binding protein [Candidatus Omnitrophota bacterium]
MKRIAACFVLAGVLLSSPVFAATYKVDPAHSTVSFKIRHLFSQVQGQFNEFEGVIEYEPGKPETWKASGAIQTASIDTNVAKRDEHLRTADFFDAAKYPTITFKSVKFTDATDKGAKMEGLLSMHGVEKAVVLDVQAHGVGKDPWGNVRAGFSATTTINRKDFGLTWNETLETGQFLVGEEVVINLEIEGIEQ